MSSPKVGDAGVERGSTAERMFFRARCDGLLSIGMVAFSMYVLGLLERHDEVSRVSVRPCAWPILTCRFSVKPVFQPRERTPALRPFCDFRIRSCEPSQACRRDIIATWILSRFTSERCRHSYDANPGNRTVRDSGGTKSRTVEIELAKRARASGKKKKKVSSLVLRIIFSSTPPSSARLRTNR